MINRIKNSLLSFLILLLIQTQGFTQTIIKHPNSTQNLNERWKWAEKKSKESEHQNGFWIGYSINRLMGENSYTGSFNSDRSWKEKSLVEIVYGKRIKPLEENLTDDQKVRKAAKRVLEELENPNKPGKKILKEVAFLFRFDKSSKDISEVKISNLLLPVDLDNVPLIWIGKTNDAETIDKNGTKGSLH